MLWWGRFDPDYSRNRILRKCYTDLGWQVTDFFPWLSPTGHLEAALRRPPHADLIHVPCFRQRDLAAASRYARRNDIPLLFDPLISAYDKQVFERAKFAVKGVMAQRLLTWERNLFARADLLLADTTEHARFFAETLGVSRDRLHVVYVGAEEALFSPEPAPRPPNSPLEVLFYGSFIPLQGPEVIIEAARLCQDLPVDWVLLGHGPLHAECVRRAAGLPNVFFEDWVPYMQLPGRIHQADILLGVFGATPKSQRVIPNKVFQALACGKPLITCRAPSYPGDLASSLSSGVRWVRAGDSRDLAEAVTQLALESSRLQELGQAARVSYEKYFDGRAIHDQLKEALAAL